MDMCHSRFIKGIIIAIFNNIKFIENSPKTMGYRNIFKSTRKLCFRVVAVLLKCSCKHGIFIATRAKWGYDGGTDAPPIAQKA